MGNGEFSAQARLELAPVNGEEHGVHVVCITYYPLPTLVGWALPTFIIY